jgi:hypothetical protein
VLLISGSSIVHFCFKPDRLSNHSNDAYSEC